jgi:hypothetical protein
MLSPISVCHADQMDLFPDGIIGTQKTDRYQKLQQVAASLKFAMLLRHPAQDACLRREPALSRRMTGDHAGI